MVRYTKTYRKKECLFCKSGSVPSYKDVESLNKFTTERCRIVGRAVLLFSNDLEKVEEILSPTFEIQTIKKGCQDKAEDQFGYEADHYELRYKDVSGPYYHRLKGIKFELQVRTVLMDAWDSVSRELEYKTPESIPTDLRRGFFALSGMFVVADQEFQRIKDEILMKQKQQVQKTKNPNEFINQEINLDTLKAYLKYKFPERWEEDQNKPTPRVSDHEFSALVKEIKRIGYGKLSALDKAVEAAKEIEFEEEKRVFPDGGHRALTGTVRVILDLFEDKYFARHQQLRKGIKGKEYQEMLERLVENRKRVKKEQRAS